MKRYRLVKGAEWALFESEEGEYYDVDEVDPTIAELQKKIEEYENFENRVKSMALEKEVSDDHILAENEELKKKLKECEQKIEELEDRYARGAGGGLSGQ